MKHKKCCFIGHRKINITDELKNRLTAIIENLIVHENVTTFFFGSKSRFDDLCHKTVSGLKEKYPNIKRVYIRAEFPYIDEDFKAYLLQRFEEAKRKLTSRKKAHSLRCFAAPIKYKSYDIEL